MPYTVALKTEKNAHKVRGRLLAAIEGSRFTAELTVVDAPTRKYAAGIIVKPVRLKEAKLYCGQHPGECLIGPKRKSRCLEWDDWVEFHNLINQSLDAYQTDADVWTNPLDQLDQGKKMWVRRGMQARVKWGWFEEPARDGFGIFRPARRIWNHGTEDQFNA